MEQAYRPGDVKITKCQLSSIDGKRKLDIGRQVSIINIFESIVQPVLLAEFSVVDGIGLLESFPIIGEEILDLEFQTPALDKLKYSFRVYLVADVVTTQNNKQRSYVLHTISVEGFTNNTVAVSKRFKQQISKSVEQLVTEDLKSKKKIKVESTIGIDDHLVTNLPPLQAIDKLRLRAVSDRYKSSSFVFYEDSDGFKFSTLESMIKKATKPDITWVYDDTFDTSAADEDKFRDMISYVPVQAINTIDKLQYGGTTNEIKHFDMITGEVKEVKYNDDSNSFDKTGAVGREQSSAFHKEFGKSIGVKRLYSISGETAQHLVEKTSNLPGFVNKINQNIVNAVVFGDSSLRLGVPVECRVIKATGLTEPKVSKNNYIVSKIRHIIMNSTRPVYTQSCELIGNSYAS